MNNSSKRGITLIALIITVIVLLILAGTAVSIAINGGDIFERATQAKDRWNNKVAEEENKINDVWNILNTMTGGNKITMELDGTNVTFDQSDFAQYLGKVATKYTGAATTVNERTVSNTYRLYWIDWDNKYGDGAGTIYLKADVPASGTTAALSLEAAPTEEQGEETVNIEATNENALIRRMNKEIYKNGYENAPDPDCDTMKAVRWLLNPSNWENLKISSYSAKTNYVVGAPSIEMMIDSFNAHYGLVGDTPDATWLKTAENPRTKLFYSYPSPNGSTFGYAVGPMNSESSFNKEGFYGCYTTINSISSDVIDSMYYPGIDKVYWLASPLGPTSGVVACVEGSKSENPNYEERLSCVYYTFPYYLCPLVSLQADVQL